MYLKLDPVALPRAVPCFPAGGVAAAMLLRIFTAACRPLLAVLHGWLNRGQLDDPAGEFFVQCSGALVEDVVLPTACWG